MGNENQKQASFTKEINVFKTEDDDRFGPVSHGKKNNGQPVIVKESDLIKIAKHEFDNYIDWIRSLPQYSRIFTTLDTKMLLQEQPLGYCTQEVHTLAVMMEYFEKNLELELIQRSHPDQRQQFPEDEIWMLFDALVEVERHFQSSQTQRQIHGDLRLTTIFVADDGSLKFLDPFLVNWMTNDLMFALQYGTSSKVLLAPERLTNLREEERSKEGTETTEAGEVWTIGLILLCMCSLKTGDHFYNKRMITLEMGKIQSTLLEISRNYSSRMCELIGQCLKENPAERINLQKLLQFKSPLQSSNINN